MQGLCGGLDVICSCKIVGKNFPPTRRFSILERSKCDKVSFLFFRSSVPRSMKGNEGSVSVPLRKHIACIKKQSVGSHVSGKKDYRVNSFIAPFLLTIPTILGGENFFLLKWIIVNIRPTTIISLLDSIHGFGREFGTLFCIVQFRIQLKKLIPPMLHDKQLIVFFVPVKPNNVTQTGCVTFSICISLIQFRSIELPNTGCRIQDRARRHSLRPVCSILLLACI